MPLAVDTNVLARALVDDGTDQCLRARTLLAEEDVFIGDTVLLETEWLLRSVMKIGRDDLNRIFSVLVATTNFSFADRPRIANCLVAQRMGLDFADAMHLYAADGNDAFATFDEDFQRKSKVLPNGIPVVPA
jgi:predicted nucleic-acid-binding protein